MARIAILDGNNIIANIVNSTVSQVSAAGFTCIQTDTGKIGQQYVNGEWVTPPEPAQAVPRTITNYQMKAQLDAIGKYDAAITAVAKLPATHLVSRAWNNSPVISRNGVFTAYVTSALKLTESQMDSFFQSASVISD